ncbi:hypothetical protein [Derxia lacustris]|uniref:hypothetical protein n=1 Tax=Derxia lacustris TaxID=764842 RepID=UPI00111C46D8|nr:hypothetical protein [Derxia lacustris]
MRRFASMFRVVLTLLTSLAASTANSADSDKAGRLAAPSPIVAQQQLSDLLKQIDQLSVEINARETAVGRLRAELEKTKSMTLPPVLERDVEKFAKWLEDRPKSKEGYVISQSDFPFFQNYSSKIADDVWDAFPGILEIWRAVKRDARTVSLDEQYLQEFSDGFQAAVWQAPALRYVDELRRPLYFNQNIQSFAVAQTSSAELRTYFNKDGFEKIAQVAKEYLTKEIARHDAGLVTARGKMAVLKESQKELNETIEEGQSQIDKKIIQWGLPVLGLLLIGILVIPVLYKDKELQAAIFASGIVLDVFTVFLLTVTILLLGLGHRLSENVLGTLLGGISGYVLGRSNNRLRQAGNTG